MPIKQDWGALSTSLESGLKSLLGELIDGTIETLDGPIRETSALLTTSIRAKRPELVEAARDQLALIILEKEIRLKSSSSHLFDQILNLGMNALINGAIGGLGALKAL